MHITLAHAGEATCCHTLLESLKNVTCLAVASIEITLCEVHRHLMRGIDLLPEVGVLLLSQYLCIIEKAVEEDGDLEDIDIQLRFHCDLYKEWIRWWALSIYVLLINRARKNHIGRLRWTRQLESISGVSYVNGEGILIEADIEVLLQYLTGHISHFNSKAELLLLIAEEVSADLQTCITILSGLSACKNF